LLIFEGSKKQKFWQGELKQDPMAIFLLQSLYKKTTKNPFLFEDRFSGGDNFLASLSSVEISPKGANVGDPFKITYVLDFGMQFATLDAIITGDMKVSIR
jgi:hypothetical protein